MSSVFGSHKVKAPPPVPETPPAASSGDDLVTEKKRLKKKQGDKANLMTGGLGLSQISSGNLYTHTLGGYNPTGARR
jgi:hypothetical protein